ncbi:MAG: prepilin-type N-terminal cleavage/methylation domain-containing protein [Bdellovibrionota bacterium]
MRLKSSRGFTLVEILLVLGIMAAAIAIGATRINRKDNNMKTVARKMTTVVREIRNKAKLYNTTYRLVINLDPKSPTYTVEQSAGRVQRDSEEDIKAREKMDADKRPADSFRKDSAFGKKDKELPSGLFFGQLETINLSAPITEGVGYIYFSPEGFVEYSSIQITDRKNLTWTLVFNPLTGQADIIQEAKALKDLKQ